MLGARVETGRNCFRALRVRQNTDQRRVAAGPKHDGIDCIAVGRESHGGDSSIHLIISQLPERANEQAAFELAGTEIRDLAAVSRALKNRIERNGGELFALNVGQEPPLFASARAESHDASLSAECRGLHAIEVCGQRSGIFVACLQRIKPRVAPESLEQRPLRVWRNGHLLGRPFEPLIAGPVENQSIRGRARLPRRQLEYEQRERGKGGNLAHTNSLHWLDVSRVPSQ